MQNGLIMGFKEDIGREEVLNGTDGWGVQKLKQQQQRRLMLQKPLGKIILSFPL